MRPYHIAAVPPVEETSCRLSPSTILEILYLQTLYSIDVGNHLIMSFLYGMSLRILHTLSFKGGFYDVWRNGTLVRSQQSITAALAEPSSSRTIGALHDLTL